MSESEGIVVDGVVEVGLFGSEFVAFEVVIEVVGGWLAFILFLVLGCVFDVFTDGVG